jgi:hypothetical protein
MRIRSALWGLLALGCVVAATIQRSEARPQQMWSEIFPRISSRALEGNAADRPRTKPLDETLASAFQRYRTEAKYFRVPATDGLGREGARTSSEVPPSDVARRFTPAMPWSCEVPEWGTCVVCTDTCTGPCTNWCTFECTGECTIWCTGACTEICTANCTFACTRWCTTTCTQACTGSCTHECTAPCTYNCTVECTNPLTFWAQVKPARPTPPVATRRDER